MNTNNVLPISRKRAAIDHRARAEVEARRRLLSDRSGQALGSAAAASAKTPALHASRILIVDHDSDTRDTLSGYLGARSFRISSASNRHEMVELLARDGCDLVILDGRLGTDSMDVLRDLKSRHDVPIIILAGTSGSEADCIVGLELGADDYMTRPVAFRELLARIRTILRRYAATGRYDEPIWSKSRFVGWVVDRRLRTLTNPSGAPVKLTKSEYALLVAFLDAPGRPLSREALLHATRVHEDVFDRSIDVQILRLRRKLERNPAAPRMILTERGLGYVFAASVDGLL